MSEHKRLFNLLQLISILSKRSGISVERLANRFQVTKRTIYRYFDILRECGFDIEKNGKRHRLSDLPESRNILPYFTAEEEAVIHKAILSLHSSHPNKSGLLKKLKRMVEPSNLAEIIVDARTAANTAILITAMREQKRVVLYHYHSPNSESVMNRTVDPVGFAPNMKYLYAFEPDRRKVIQFKPERIESVKITGISFTPDDDYHIEKPDIFGMNGLPLADVTLTLYPRAIHLLLEEYPESRDIKGLADYRPNSSSDINHIDIRISVKGFEGVGRFVLGLPGEVVPLSPPEFLNYLQERNKRCTESLRLLKSSKKA